MRRERQRIRIHSNTHSLSPPEGLQVESSNIFRTFAYKFRISGEIQEYIRTLVLKSSRDVLKISSIFEEKI